MKIKHLWVDHDHNTVYYYFGLKKIKFGFLGENVRLSPNHSFFGCPQNMYIYENVFIGRDNYFDAVSEIHIGSGTMIGPRCTFIGSSHNYDSHDLKSLPYDNIILDRKIIIEKNVWIGANVMVSPGTHIGEGAVIGAGACVYGDIPPFAVVVSSGYRIAKKRNEAKYHELEDSNAIYNTMFAGKPFVLKDEDNE